MKHFFVLLIMAFYTPFLFGQGSFDVVSVGEKAPDFTVKTIEDKTLCLDELKGKYVLINFFATWCKPCMEEMPLIEKYIQQRFDESDLVVIAIGREHNINELDVFNQRKKFTFNIAADPKRNIYSMYAQKFIPRLYLVDKTGKLIYAHSGYKKSEFDKLINLLETKITK